MDFASSPFLPGTGNSIFSLASSRAIAMTRVSSFLMISPTGRSSSGTFPSKGCSTASTPLAPIVFSMMASTIS